MGSFGFPWQIPYPGQDHPDCEAKKPSDGYIEYIRKNVSGRDRGPNGKEGLR
jgi:hypothetical protein